MDDLEDVEILALHVRTEVISRLQAAIVSPVLIPFHELFRTYFDPLNTDVVSGLITEEPFVSWIGERAGPGIVQALEIVQNVLTMPLPRADGVPIVKIQAGLAYGRGRVRRLAELANVIPGGYYGEQYSAVGLRASRLCHAAPAQHLLVDAAALTRFRACFAETGLKAIEADGNPAWLVHAATLQLQAGQTQPWCEALGSTSAAPATPSERPAPGAR
jgi:hypothetical protein